MNPASSLQSWGGNDMNVWLAWGIPVIVGLQHLGDWLTVPMKVFSFLGTEEFYLLVMPGILWCLDAAMGVRLGLLLLCSASLNAVAKLIFGWPRPYWVSDQVRALSTEGSYGLPSGHSQDALSVWGGLATGLRRRVWTIGLGALILLISISRLYLGVHFPIDVLAGWLVAGALLAGFVALEAPFVRWLRRLRLGLRLLVPVAASSVIVVLGLSVGAATASRVVPEAWISGAAAAAPGSAPISPQDTSGLLAAAATLLGLGVGAILLFDWGGFRASGPWAMRLGRFAVGVAGVALIYFGMRLILPEGDSFLPQALRFLRYATVGFWITYLAPRAFVRLRLA
jgi:membrane-associated phospholipid phosphatase